MTVPMIWRTVVLTVLLGIAFPGCSSGDRVPSWRLILQHDHNGKTLSGSRKALSDALKRGSPMRVAWGEKLQDGRSVVEFAVPDFISLMADSEVVVQFPMHILQTNYVDADKAFLRTSPPPSVWRALMSSDGHYHQFHYDLKTGEIVRIMYARTAMNWYAFVPVDDDRQVPELALPNTFVLDSLWRK